MTEARKKELILALLRDEITADEVLKEINKDYVTAYDVAKLTGITPQSLYTRKSLRRFFVKVDDRLQMSRSMIPDLVAQFEANKKRYSKKEGKANDK